jgi:hypothetical protein
MSLPRRKAAKQTTAPLQRRDAGGRGGGKPKAATRCCATNSGGGSDGQSEGAPVVRMTRRAARVPAGQPKDAAPSRSARIRAAGKSAPFKAPAQYSALLIATQRAKTQDLVRVAHRAGCRR